jgi:hypothetical protein
MTRFPPALVGLLLLAGSTWAQSPRCALPAVVTPTESGDVVHRLLPTLFKECEQAIAAQDLYNARLLAQFAYELAPDSQLSRRMDWMLAKALSPTDRGTSRTLELLPAPTELQGDSALVSLPCEHSEPISTEAPRVQLRVPGIEASADRMSVVTNPGEPSKILLEGHVEINLTQTGRPAQILTSRALIDPEDGSYEVMPVHFAPQNIKPTSYIVPSTPMERGWR